MYPRKKFFRTGIAPYYASGGGNSTAYTNFAARCSAAGAPLAGSDITNYSTLLNGLTTDGIFASDGTSALLDALYILAAPSATVALLDLTNNAHNLTANGSPSFTAYQGYTGVDASTTVYLDTSFNPGAGGANYTQNSAHLSAWVNNNLTSGVSGGAVIGVGGASINTHIFPKYNDGNSYYDTNDNGATAGVANASSIGFYVSNRSGASAQQGYKNAVDQSVGAVTSGAMVSANIVILAQRVEISNVITFGSALQISMASIGASLSSANVTILNSRIGTYRTAVGL